MRSARVRVADALDDGQLVLVVQRLERLQVGVEADLIVQVEHLVGGDPDLGSKLVIQPVAVGDDGVQAVVAAAELDHDQGALARAHRRRRCGTRGLGHRCSGRDLRGRRGRCRRRGRRGRFGPRGRRRPRLGRGAGGGQAGRGARHADFQKVAA